MNYFPMHVSSGWCLAIVLMTAMTSPSATAQTPLPPVPKDVWVNAETGLDTNNGSFRFPWQTLGYALDEAATVNVDSDPHNNIGKIYVMYTARPIAPQGFGVPVIGGAPALDGREDPMHAFPFEVPENVSVVGVADSSGNKPWVTVYETQHTAIPSKLTYTWPKIAVGSPLLARLGTTKPMFILATGATLNNLFLDGSPFRTKLNPANGTVVPLLGVYVDDSQDVTIANCVIHDMHDGIIFQENGVTAVDANLTLRRLTSGNVQSCVISGSFPGFPRFPGVTVASESTFALANDQGHAGLWAIVRESGTSTEDATVDLTVTSCTFELNHDGIETDTNPVKQDPPLPPLTYTNILLRTTQCLFQRNENGIEAVAGTGTNPCTVDVLSCTFLEHFNRPACIGGYQASTVPQPPPPMPLDGATVTGAIVHRNKDASLYVRDSAFYNNATCVVMGGTASTDLGTETDLGLNAFLVDASASVIPVPGAVGTDYESNCNQPEHFEVLNVFLGSPTVLAAGNRWFPFTQCTVSDAAGCPYGCSGDIVTGPISSTATSIGMTSTANRNFVLSTGAVVDLGLDSGGSPICPSGCGVPPCVGGVPGPTCAPFPSCP